VTSRSDGTRSKSRWVKTVPSSAAHELADPAGQDGVREETDRERREDEWEARMRIVDRLRDHDRPRDRTDSHRDEVEADRDDDPLPAYDRERVPDGAPVGTAPPDEQADPDGREQNDCEAQRAAVREEVLHPAAASAAGSPPATCS
jgi:hypothetical protein